MYNIIDKSIHALYNKHNDMESNYGLSIKNRQKPYMANM